MSESYIGNQPNQGLGLPDVQVKDNVVLDIVSDGVNHPEFLFENADDVYDIVTVTNDPVATTIALFSNKSFINSDYQTNWLENNAGTVTAGYGAINEFMPRNNGEVSQTVATCSYNGTVFQWESRSGHFLSTMRTTFDTGFIKGSVSTAKPDFIRFALTTGAVIPAGIHIIVTRRTLNSEKVVYANGQSIQKNYLHNTGNWVNQSGYVYGTPVTTASQRLTDRWLANANPSSISYSTPSDPDLMTIVGGIYQGLEINSLSGKVCVLHWEGTAQASLWRINGNASNFQDSPIVFTMPTGVGGGGEMEYVSFGAGTLKHMKLEVGEVPTKWEPEEIATQFNICQRFYEPNGRLLARNFASSTQATFTNWIFNVDKRVVPTVSLTGVGQTAQYIDRKGVVLREDIASLTNADFLAGSVTADAEIL